MVKIIREETLELRPGGTIRFEGETFGAGGSFFHVKAEPGTGSSLHKHPYPETWLVRAGQVRFTVGGQEYEGTPGDIVIADAGIPHKYLNVGTERLEMFCVHPSPRILQEAVAE